MSFFLNKIVNFLENKNKVFFTFHLRPYLSSSVNKNTEKNNGDVAIIIQGPIVYEKNFTLETIKTYLKNFPGSHIVLSTWTGQDIKDFKKLKIDLILNEKPKNSGISNINYQIVSTYNGIIEAKKNNVTYVLKTRTDQRIYSEKALDYFKDILRIFPLETGKIPRGRIITTDINTFRFRPYSISDMTLFGFYEDMFNYWNLKTDEREETKFKYKNVLEWSKHRLCEVYLSTNYLEEIGKNLNWTISNSWKTYIEYFCIVDRSTIDLFWFKYEKNKEYRRRKYSGNFMDEEFGFVDWLKLYNSENFNNKYEYLLDKQIDEEI